MRTIGGTGNTGVRHAGTSHRRSTRKVQPDRYGKPPPPVPTAHARSRWPMPPHRRGGWPPGPTGDSGARSRSSPRGTTEVVLGLLPAASPGTGPGRGPGTVTAMVCHAIRPAIQDSGQQDHGDRDLNQYSGGRPDRPDCRRGGHVSTVLAPERTAVAVEANPRAISQMPNVSSNNPPGMELTSAAPATPNSSSSVPPAKHA
jgi:hypothetical protein